MKINTKKTTQKVVNKNNIKIIKGKCYCPNEHSLGNENKDKCWYCAGTFK